MDLTIYSKVFVLVLVLIRYVLSYDLVGHIAGTTAEVSSRPEMPPPKLFLQVRKLS
jgi:hypothetical protein